MEDDCWLCGNVTIVAGVRIGRGATVGAGSIVTKDVKPFTLVAGNPARFIRAIESAWDVEGKEQEGGGKGEVKGPEEAQAEHAVKVEDMEALESKWGKEGGRAIADWLSH